MDLVSTCTRIKNWSKGAKVMQLDGTSFRVKPPPAAADVLRDQPGSARVRGGRAPGRARPAPRGRRLLRRRVALLPRRAPAAPPPARGPTVLPFRPPRGWEGHGAPDRAGRRQMLFVQSYGSAGCRSGDMQTACHAVTRSLSSALQPSSNGPQHLKAKMLPAKSEQAKSWRSSGSAKTSGWEKKGLARRFADASSSSRALRRRLQLLLLRAPAPALRRPPPRESGRALSREPGTTATAGRE
jgi:hypothetical protein